VTPERALGDARAGGRLVHEVDGKAHVQQATQQLESVVDQLADKQTLAKVDRS
jgi:hypothetical protein